MSKLSQWLDKEGYHQTTRTQPSTSDTTPTPIVPPPVGDKPLVSDAEIKAGTEAVLKMVSDAGFGSWVTESQCKEVVTNVLIAAARVR